MRTIVYIDGFNFYFGVLRGTDYKWLDIVKLVKHICHIQNPDIDIIAVKFFTAPVMTALATRGDKAGRSQDAYHRALKNSYPNTIEIINGFYVKEKATPPRYKKPADKLDRVEVWKLEEKQTDVNIALHLYRDAILKNCECSVLVSSDSDIEPALHFLCQDFPAHHIGLIIRRRTGSSESLKNLLIKTGKIRRRTGSSEICCKLDSSCARIRRRTGSSETWLILYYSQL